ncbi:MAG: hypothetical protein QN137_01930, partial [Armatimonadota bacterium]|nr:hypothetical protein [Armatimonadota bacterium]
PAARETVREEPALAFDRYGIALHFLAPPEDALGRQTDAAARESSDEFRSFERDLLSYAYRGAPPLGSHVLPVPEHLRRMTLHLPPCITYVSEGLIVDLLCAEQHPAGDRRRAVGVRASRTDFRSGLAVYHLVLTPDGEPAATALSEYDLVKLVKLWEGGEDVPMHSLVTFEPPGGGRLDVGQLARAVFGPAARLHPAPRLGTVQIVTSSTAIKDRLAWVDVLQAIQTLRDGNPLGDGASAPTLLDQAIKGTGGILQGLLDFHRIGAGELADVFASARVTDDALIAVHKGSILSLASVDRAFEAAAATIGISPYLLGPQAVLAHNEEMLDRADRASQLSSRKPRALAAARKEMQAALDRHHLPNIFHYPTERLLYETGTVSRGLRDREQDVRANLAKVTGEWETAVDRRRRVAEDLIAAILLLVGGGELVDRTFPLEYVFPPLALAGALYLLWRWRMT